jgi:hypothetical protein
MAMTGTYRKAKDTANKTKVGEVVWVDGGVRVDLEEVGLVGRILKKTVVGVEHLTREQVEPFSVYRVGEREREIDRGREYAHVCEDVFKTNK